MAPLLPIDAAKSPYVTPSPSNTTHAPPVFSWSLPAPAEPVEDDPVAFPVRGSPGPLNPSTGSIESTFISHISLGHDATLSSTPPPAPAVPAPAKPSNTSPTSTMPLSFSLPALGLPVQPSTSPPRAVAPPLDPSEPPTVNTPPRDPAKSTAQDPPASATKGLGLHRFLQQRVAELEAALAAQQEATAALQAQADAEAARQHELHALTEQHTLALEAIRKQHALELQSVRDGANEEGLQRAAAADKRCVNAWKQTSGMDLTCTV